MDEFELEIKQDFLVESEDLFEAAESAFLRLENERDNPELLNEIFRLAHNLKGTAMAVGFTQLADFTHIAENLILKLKDGSLEVTDEIVSVLLKFKDHTSEIVDGLKQDFDATFDLKEILGELEAATNDDQSVETKAEINVEVESVVESVVEPETESVVNEPIMNSAALESLKALNIDIDAQEVLEEIPGLSFQNVDKLDELPKEEKIVTKEAPVQKKASADSDESIRVKLERIDKLNNIIGELVILQTVVSQRRFEFIQDDLTNKSIGMMSKLFKEVQELSMSLRMLPLKNTFQKMNRIVRDTSSALDKKVKLSIRGEETEVDKTVLEKLGDPLVHIIRNAVDHGLEDDPQERIAQGKTAEGNVELYAYHEGSYLVIEITDDGKGIDPEVIRKKAIEKNVIKENSNLNDNEIINLIFHAGFSTKEEVTGVSGRGVGMDVVKTNIEILGGEVILKSELGKGSSFKIILPLTLAIIEGIVINCENEKFVVPLTQIFEIAHVQSSDIETFSGVAKLFKLRGEVLPLFFINHKLGKKEKEETSHTVIIVRGAQQAFGVVVDNIINQQQIVIKKLGEDLSGKQGIIGSAIMSDGMPSLILDLFELFREQMKQSTRTNKFKNEIKKIA
jgi:two-component system chemotaxis sensor kinase CheA